MNYLASGLQSGWDTGQKIAADAKRRKFEQEENQRRIDAELNRDVKRSGLDRALQNDRLVADAQRLFDTQKYGTSEREATQAFGTGERLGRQGFEAGERGLDRGLTRTEGAANRLSHEGIAGGTLAQRKAEFEATLPLEKTRVATGVRHQDMLENPDSPTNRIAAARVLNAGNEIDLNAGGAWKLKPVPPATPTVITSEAEFNKLKSGDKFIYKGRSGTVP